MNAIEPLPIVEYSTPRSMGYNGSDLFSPEMDYQVDDAELDRYLGLVNRLLAQKGKSPLTRERAGDRHQPVKALIDICHHYGIAVILDVVYNHASGDVKGQPESIYFFDRAAGTNPNDSLYFTDQDHTGPVFAFWNQDVRQFLIDNAKFFVDEYHVDGFRYDQVTVIDKQNAGSGWLFCQHLNATLNAAGPVGDQHRGVLGTRAGGRPRRRTRAAPDSMRNWHDGLREAIRGVIAQASGGQRRVRRLAAGRRTSFARLAFRDAWRAVQYVESHDEVYRDRGLRIPSLAVGGGEHPDLACDEPLARGDRPPPDRAGHPDALHGPGVLRGQALGRRRAEPSGNADVLGRSQHGQDDERLPPVHARTDVAAPQASGAARRRGARRSRWRTARGCWSSSAGWKASGATSWSSRA